MSIKKKRKHHPVPLRAIAKECNLSLPCVQRVIAGTYPEFSSAATKKRIREAEAKLLKLRKGA